MPTVGMTRGDVVGKHSADEWRAPLALVMLCGSARADASPEQLERLRGEVMPLLLQFREDGVMRPVVEKIVKIMGVGWKPSGDWDLFLRKLLEKSDGQGS